MDENAVVQEERICEMKTIKQIFACAILMVVGFLFIPFIPLLAAWIAYNERDEIEEE